MPIPTHPFALAGKVAFVSGASQGLGLVIAKALARAGAAVTINGRDEVRLRAAAQSAAQEHVTLNIAAFDASGPDAPAALEEFAKRAGRLDVLINNVGLRQRKTLFEFSRDDLRALLDADLVGPMLLARAAATAMIAREGGRIVNITSIAGHVARAGDAAYTAAKGGFTALTKALAVELAPHHITVNAIAPGFFATESNVELVNHPEIGRRWAKRTAVGRWADPEEIAGAAVFLASDKAAYITGHVLVVDGGTTAMQ